MRKNNAVRVVIIYTLIAGSFFLYQSWKRYTLSQDLSTGKYLEERFKQDSLFSLKKGIHTFNKKKYIPDVNRFHIKDKKTPCLSAVIYPDSYDYNPVYRIYEINNDTILTAHYSLKSTFLPFFDIKDPNFHYDSEGNLECYDVKKAYFILKRYNFIGENDKLFYGYKIDSLLKH